MRKNPVFRTNDPGFFDDVGNYLVEARRRIAAARARLTDPEEEPRHQKRVQREVRTVRDVMRGLEESAGARPIARDATNIDTDRVRAGAERRELARTVENFERAQPSLVERGMEAVRGSLDRQLGRSEDRLGGIRGPSPREAPVELRNEPSRASAAVERQARQARQEEWEQQPTARRIATSAAGSMVNMTPLISSLADEEKMARFGELEPTGGERAARILGGTAGVAGTMGFAGAAIGFQGQVAGRVAPALSGPLGSLARGLSAPGTVGRGARSLAGALEGIPIDIALSPEGTRLQNVGLGTAIGAGVGAMIPGSRPALSRAEALMERVIRGGEQRDVIQQGGLVTGLRAGSERIPSAPLLSPTTRDVIRTTAGAAAGGYAGAQAGETPEDRLAGAVTGAAVGALGVNPRAALRGRTAAANPVGAIGDINGARRIRELGLVTRQRATRDWAVLDPVSGQTFGEGITEDAALREAQANLEAGSLSGTEMRAQERVRLDEAEEREFQEELAGHIGNVAGRSPTGAAEYVEDLRRIDPTAPEEPERITAAAWRDRSGKVYTGAVHADIYPEVKAEIASSYMDPKMGQDFARRFDPDIDGEDGFVTSTGRFVGRADALQIAQNARQWNGRNRMRREPDGRPGLFAEAVEELRTASRFGNRNRAMPPDNRVPALKFGFGEDQPSFERISNRIQRGEASPDELGFIERDLDKITWISDDERTALGRIIANARAGRQPVDPRVASRRLAGADERIAEISPAVDAEATRRYGPKGSSLLREDEAFAVGALHAATGVPRNAPTDNYARLKAYNDGYNWQKEVEAGTATKWGPRAGATTREAMRTVAGAGAGAAIGAAADPENRLEGAAAGAIAGAAGVNPRRVAQAARDLGTTGAVGAPSSFAERTYSRLERAIQNAPFQKGSAGQWRAQLGKNVAKGEREWTGVDRLLDEAEASGRTLTRDELQQHFDQNRIRITETVRDQKTANAVRRPETRAAQERERELGEPTRAARRELLLTMSRHGYSDNEIESMVSAGVSPNRLDPLAGPIPAELRRRINNNAMQALEAIRRHDNLGYDDAASALRAVRHDAARRTPAEVASLYDMDPAGRTAVQRWLETDLEVKQAQKAPAPKEVQDAYRVYVDRYSDQAAARAEADRLIREDNAQAERVKPKYPHYTEEGGENYREILIQQDRTQGYDIQDRSTWSPEFTRKADDLLARRDRGEIDYNEWKRQFDQLDNAASRGGDFHSSHFEQPNILAHARVKDRTLPNGEKVLFVEEIQSDWHQGGRDRGYKGVNTWTPDQPLPAGYHLVDEAEQLRRGDIAPSDMGEGFYIVDEETASTFADASTREEALRLFAEGYNSGMVPNAPFKKTEEWVGLTLRRLIDEAVEGDYDRIAWTTGAQQKARYGNETGDQIDQLNWRRTDDGKYEVEGLSPRGDQVYRGTHSASELDDVIGHTYAQRIRDTPERPGEEWNAIHGEDIQIGGSGMNVFYDKMVPGAVRDYAKRLGVRIDVEPAPTGGLGPVDTKGWTVRRGRVNEKLDQLDYAVLDADGKTVVARNAARIAPDEELIRQAAEQVNAHRASEGKRTPFPVGNPSFRITPELRAKVKQEGQMLYSGADLARGLATPTGRAAAGAGIGAAIGGATAEEGRELEGTLSGAALGAVGGAPRAALRAARRMGTGGFVDFTPRVGERPIAATIFDPNDPKRVFQGANHGEAELAFYRSIGIEDPDRGLTPAQMRKATAARVGLVEGFLGSSPEGTRMLTREEAALVKQQTGRLHADSGSLRGQTPVSVMRDAGQATITQEAQSSGRFGYGVAVPPEMARAMTDEILGIAGGHADEIASSMVGRKVASRARIAAGTWEGQRNPNVDFDHGPDVPDAVVRLKTAILGLLTGQDGAAWLRRVPTAEATADTGRGFVIATPEMGSLPDEYFDELTRVINANSDRYGALDGSHFRDGTGLWRNFTDGEKRISDDDYLKLLAEATREVDRVTNGRYNIQIHDGYFNGELLNGPSDYLKVVGRHPDAIRRLRDVLANEVGPAYQRWATRAGIDPAVPGRRIQQVVDGLDAHARAVEQSAPKGAGRGKVSVPQAAVALSGRFRPIPKGSSPKDIVRLIVPRLTKVIDDFVNESGLSSDMVRDWYSAGTEDQRKILTLIQPERANDNRHILATAYHSIISNGNPVVAETRAGAGVFEQWVKTGNVSLFDPKNVSYQRFPLERKGGQVQRQLAIEGKRGVGIGGERYPAQGRPLTHEKALRRLQQLISEKGEEGAVQYLLSSRTMRDGKVKHRAVEEFGPKIGQYFLDKIGVPSEGSTIDLWMARLYDVLAGRKPKIITGKGARGKGSDNFERLADNVSPLMRAVMQQALKQWADQNGAKPSSAQAIAWYAIKNLFRQVGAAEKPDAYATLATAASDLVSGSIPGKKLGDESVRMGFPKPNQRVVGEPEKLDPVTLSPMAGFATREILRTAANAAVGSVLGGVGDLAFGDDQAGWEGALLGAAIGAGVANLRLLERSLRRRAAGRGAGGTVGTAAPPVKGLTDEQIDAILKTVPAPSQKTSLPPVTGTTVNAADYLNIAKFAQDPAGEDILKQEMLRVVQNENLAPKEVIPWRTTVAKSLGLDPEDLLETTDTLDRVQALAARNIITTNIDFIKHISNELSNTTLTQTQRELLQIRLNGLESQNEALLLKFTKARSEAGRLLNSFRILANSTMDPITWLSKAQKMAGDDFDDEVRANVLKFINNKDRAGLIQYVSLLRKASYGEMAATLFRAGLLTNPVTHIVNALGNIGHFAFLQLADQPAAFTDLLLSMGTKTRTKHGISGATMVAAARGAKKGVSEISKVMRGIPLEDALKKYDIPKEVNFESKFLDTYTKTVFRLLSASDRVFRGAALQASLAEQAQVLARAEGLKGAAKAKRVQQLIDQPTEEMGLRAIDAAEKATFTNDTAAARALGHVTREFPVLEYVIPFKRTPSAIGTAILEYGGGGFLTGGWDAIQVLRAATKGKPLPKLQQRAAERIGRAATGMLPIWVGYTLYKRGQATGSYPTEQAERNESQLEQRPHNSILIGKTWIGVGRFAPIGNLIALGANIAAARENPELTALDRAASGAFSAIKTVADQPMVTGIREVTESLYDPERYAGDMIKGQIGSVVPAAVAAVARATDPYVRETESLPELVGSRIPGVSRTLEPRLTALGDPVRRGDTGFSSLINPTMSAPDVREGDPVVSELSRVGASRLISPLRRETDESSSAVNRRRAMYGRALRRELQSLFEGNHDRSAEYRAIPRQAAERVQTDPNYQGRDPQELARQKQSEIIDDVEARLRRRFQDEQPWLRAPAAAPR